MLASRQSVTPQPVSVTTQHSMSPSLWCARCTSKRESEIKESIPAAAERGDDKATLWDIPEEMEWTGEGHTAEE